MFLIFRCSGQCIHAVNLTHCVGVQQVDDASGGSVCTHCVRQRRRMLWRTGPTSPRCRRGWAMPMSRRRASMTIATIATIAPKIRRHFAPSIEQIIRGKNSGARVLDRPNKVLHEDARGFSWNGPFPKRQRSSVMPWLRRQQRRRILLVFTSWVKWQAVSVRPARLSFEGRPRCSVR
jgi:hypothetical protein